MQQKKITDKEVEAENEKNIERQKEYNKAKKIISQEASIKDCFYPDHTFCKLPIISAHSIQRQGPLQILEKNDNGNKYIYCHNEVVGNFKDHFLDFKKNRKGIRIYLLWLL